MQVISNFETLEKNANKVIEKLEVDAAVIEKEMKTLKNKAADLEKLVAEGNDAAKVKLDEVKDQIALKTDSYNKMVSIAEGAWDIRDNAAAFNMPSRRWWTGDGTESLFARNGNLNKFKTLVNRIYGTNAVARAAAKTTLYELINGAWENGHISTKYSDPIPVGECSTEVISTGIK